MEPQKSAANRVRHILQAMERSIDSARSRRVGNPGMPDASLSPTANDRTSNHTGMTPANAAAVPVAKTQVPTAPAQMMIGGPPSAAAKPVSSPSIPSTSPAAVPQPPRDDQPPRLKAKPKRFEGTFNSSFSPPSAYRSQTG